jgi:hypothetical protein
MKGRWWRFATPQPKQTKKEGITFYEPKSSKNIALKNKSVYGSKSFTYDIVGEESGEYALQEYLTFVYFDPNKARYDTLSPMAKLTVFGGSTKNAKLQSSDVDDFYNTVNIEDGNAWSSLDSGGNTALFVNIFIVLLLIIIILILVLVILRTKKSSHG